ANYVLAQIRTPKGASTAASILVTAQDLFFTLAPASNPAEMVAFIKKTLPDYYKAEGPPSTVTLAGKPFVRLDYLSPVAQLHWTVLVTQLRCHTVQFIFSSSDTALLERLVRGLDAMKMPETIGESGGGTVPLCVADYALGENVLSRPAPTVEQRYNAIPVRFIIGKDGHVRHVHVISAFPEQTSAINAALMKWTFKPYLQDGQPIEIETGMMFGTGAGRPKLQAGAPLATRN
ncbi:MAG: TonB family protein, partial [Acidobacteria bacterium]|nr:TonB family protein [Acidobacteriota bacterium]